MFARSNHIPQPPHSAPGEYKGLRPYMNPKQVPSPTEIIEKDSILWENAIYTTLPGSKPPLASSNFTALDQGNSSPKFLRMTTWNMPASSRLAKKCRIPLGCVCQPFAELNQHEEPVPLVDFVTHGPPRCEGCRAYINSWCTFSDGGNRWKCNLCSHVTIVSADYYCSLDANSLRTDYQQRPELSKGTVDFAVDSGYWSSHPPARLSEPYYSDIPRPIGLRQPSPLNYIFALDASLDAVQSGFLASACAALATVLCSPTPLIPPESRVCILTYDNTIHFYDLSSALDRAPMFVVSDLDEVFVPIREGIFVNPHQSNTSLRALLESIPSRFTMGPPHQESALGSVIRAALAAFDGGGGKLTIFQATMPTIGPGALSPDLAEAHLRGTNKESVLFKPRDVTWNNIGEECAQDAVGVSFFFGSSRPVDVGSIGVVASLTGGDIFFHAKFSAERNEAVMNSQLQRLLECNTAYNCTVRVRCSSGLAVSGYYGNFNPSSPNEIDFASLDSDKAFTFTIEHTGSLSTRELAYIQVATLYTTAYGQRRVRICNLALSVVELMGNVFQFADVGATLGQLAREAFVQVKDHRMEWVRDKITERCAEMLAAYKENCAPANQKGQLVLPECFLSLPAFALGLHKSKPLKATNVSPDVRNYMIHRLNCASAQFLTQNLYPRITALHDLDDDAAVPDPNTGHIYFPFSMRDTHLHMTPDGIYLADNGESVVIWIGGSTSPQLLRDLFDEDDFLHLNAQLTSLPELPTLLSNQIRNILVHSQLQRGYFVKLQIARQNQDAAELEFSDMLVEDPNNGSLSYPDYLAILYKRVEHVMNGSDPVSLRGSPW